jgi:hypothetical protein
MAAAAAAVPVPVIPAVPPAVAFSSRPGRANLGIIDLTTRDGVKYFERASKSVFDDGATYEADDEQMHNFTKGVKERGEEYGWISPGGGILMIPPDPLQPMIGPHVNIVTNYGEKTLEEVRAWETTFLATQTRAAQDSQMLFDCLMHSLTEEAKTRIRLHEADYRIGDIGGGVMLFKVIIRESHVDTNATAAAIRVQLANLPAYMQDVGSDIDKFNRHVRLLVQGLAARSETSNDLLVNLFAGYRAAGDEEFVKYVKDKQNHYDEGNRDGITWQSLMLWAEMKYKTFKSRNTWAAPTSAQKTIVALQAQVADLNKKVKFKKQEGGNKDNPTKTKPPEKKKPKFNDPDWLKNNTKPSDDKLREPRNHRERQWWWCTEATGGKCGGMWRVHKPNECEGKAASASAGKRKNDGGGGKGGGKDGDPRKLKLAKALQGMVLADE